MKHKSLFLLFLLLTSVNLSSQTVSQEDVLRELQRRGMTVQDAERMALINGINYDCK